MFPPLLTPWLTLVLSHTTWRFPPCRCAATVFQSSTTQPPCVPRQVISYTSNQFASVTNRLPRCDVSAASILLLLRISLYVPYAVRVSDQYYFSKSKDARTQHNGLLLIHRPAALIPKFQQICHNAIWSCVLPPPKLVSKRITGEPVDLPANLLNTSRIRVLIPSVGKVLLKKAFAS
jgi:hypothetical protein